MNHLIINAIHNRRVLLLVYREIERIVHPYAYGIDRAQHEILVCWQDHVTTSTAPARKVLARLFVSRISDIREAGTFFAEPIAAYSSDDIAMSTIFAALP
jgi:hypothetical protein